MGPSVLVGAARFWDGATRYCVVSMSMKTSKPSVLRCRVCGRVYFPAPVSTCLNVWQD